MEEKEENQTNLISKEEKLAYLTNISSNPSALNYVSPSQYALLLDMVDFFTDANIKKYIIDFYMHMIPCSKRTIYFYLTRIVPNPKYHALANYIHNGKLVRVEEYYNRMMADERRRNNDVFGRGNPFQLRYRKTRWVPTTVCQDLFARMIDEIALLDHVVEFLPQINQIMKEDEQERKEAKESRKRKGQTKILPSKLSRKLSDLSDLSEPDVKELDFYLC